MKKNFEVRYRCVKEHKEEIDSIAEQLGLDHSSCNNALMELGLHAFRKSMMDNSLMLKIEHQPTTSTKRLIFEEMKGGKKK